MYSMANKSALALECECAGAPVVYSILFPVCFSHNLLCALLAGTAAFFLIHTLYLVY